MTTQGNFCAIAHGNQVKICQLSPDGQILKVEDVEVCKEPSHVIAIKFQTSSEYNNHENDCLWGVLCSDKECSLQLYNLS